MTTSAKTPAGDSACRDCMRRSWLLSALSVLLEYQCHDRGRLTDLLSLGDEELLQAVGGRRRDELRDAHARFRPADAHSTRDSHAVCRHSRAFPPGLRGPGAPSMLNVAGGLERLTELTSAPTVAIVGSDRATDYGIEMAKSIARGLAAGGVTVVGGLTDGIALAAQQGALEVEAGTVAVMAGGLDVACPARRRSLYERIRRYGCAVTELPFGCQPRRWSRAASERILARLAELTVVVEARDSPSELAGARLARILGRSVAAVPGRVTSPTSGGTHLLLMEGAHLVRGPADALELLCGVGRPCSAASRAGPVHLEPRLQATLDLVGAGRDTPEKLIREGGESVEMLLALSELELLGLLARGDGGRYVPRECSSERLALRERNR
jgi:DNA processing protein